MIERFAAAVVACCVGAATASAQNAPGEVRTTGQLASICRTDADFCMGYITGAGQLYQVLLAANEIQPTVCANPVPTLDEVRTTFLQWVAANPDRNTDKAIDGLAQSAATRWPCQR